MTIILASDHAGFKLKEAVKSFLQSKKYEVLDVGAHELIPDDDYPVYMAAAAMKVAQDMKDETKAILFGYSGEGEAVVANRFPGVRATVFYGHPKNVNPAKPDSPKSISDIVILSRMDNDSNVLSIGARFVTEQEAKEAVELWLSTPFSKEERHKRRIEEIDSIE